MEEWEKQIDGVIGDGVKPFGGHSLDSKAARRMLGDAIAEGEGEGFRSYCDKIRSAYRKVLPKTPDGDKAVEDQMKKVESIGSYFDHD